MSAQNPIGHRFGLQATRYDAVSGVQQHLADLLWKSAQPWLPYPIDKALDIGTGTGHLALPIALAKPLELHLLDLSQQMLDQALERLLSHTALTSVTLHCADALNWSPPGTQPSFDWIGSSAALQWFSNISLFLEQLRTWVKPTGVVALASFGPQTLHELHAAYLHATSKPLQTRTHMYSCDALSNAMQQAGFQIQVAESELYQMPHGSARGLLRDLKSMGVTGSSSSTFTRTQLRALEEHLMQNCTHEHGELFSTWELVWIVATPQ